MFQRGLARTRPDWGAVSASLSGAETAVLIRGGIVSRREAARELALGGWAGAGDTLVVARAGAVAPCTWGSP